ncbi:locomotion-related protein Hikaru genki [Sergentomyia squamirostris]
MKNLLCWILLAAILVHKGFSVKNVTEAPDDEDDDDWDDEDDSSEADDDGRVYKNPRNSPSSECPRDEEQANLLKQKCLRKCSSDEDCKSKKKKCLCAGACGMSCIKPDRECPELEKPELGEVNYSGRLFGSRATYSCPHGYHVVGLQSRLCLADGTWAGEEPACKQNIYCLTPPTIDHARHSALPEQATFDLDATVQYSCHIGYVTNGFPRAKCLAIDGQASWYGPDISCEPRSCGQPPDPSNGFHSGECYTFGCLIRYHCSEGYELVGKPERLCDSNGSWTPQLMPNCVLVTSVQCPPPENPKNGRAIYTSVSYNSISSYECKYGFTLVGDSSRRCGADKKWSGTLPVCKEINCEHPGVLYNGWLENIETGTGLGASIIFRCQPGMLLKGHSSTVCQIDGKWRYSVPQCLAPCVVPTISQGIVIPNESEYEFNGTTPTPGVGSISKVQHGTTLEVMCDEHYEFPISSLSPPVCNNGTWSVIPRCVPARCKSMPKPPKNGMVLAPKTEHGMKARFKCKDGFNLTGPGGKEVTDPNEYVLTCSFGNWTGTTPMCQEVYCSFPGYIPNGKVLLVGNMGLYDYRPYVRKIMNNKQIMYDCDKGYVLNEGPVGATCIGGLWRPTDLPSCLLGQHPRLRWNRRRRSASMAIQNKRYHAWVKDYLNQLAQDDIAKDQGHRRKRESDNRIIYPLTYYRNFENFPTLPVFSTTHAREKRQLSDIERAYSKYYQKIKEKYKTYVKQLLGYNSKHTNHTLANRPKQASKDRIQMQDGRWMNTYNNPEMWSRYRATHKVRTAGNENHNEDDSTRITIPDINDNRDSSEELLKQVSNLLNQEPEYQPPSKFQKHDAEALRNYQQKLEDLALSQNKNSTDSSLPSIIAQLKSQIVRKKRAIHDARTNFTTDKILNDENGNETTLGNRKNRIRIPCEPLVPEMFSSIELVRPGKNDTVEYSSGTIVKLTCLKGQLNFQNPNSTAKCVKGRWKPLKPECVTKPCTIPTADHGTYYAVDPNNPKDLAKSLSPLDDVENGQRVIFRCATGFNIQGSHNLGCNDGEWDAPAFPECMAAPCILPQLSNAAYMGGYRAELTIANGSSVSVQCENSPATAITQMECILGQLHPATPNCITPGSRKSREEFSGTNTLDPSNKSEEESEEGGGSEEETSSEEDLKNSCGPPSKMDAALVYKNSEELEPSRVVYPPGTEITFNCIASIAGERTTWKIICEHGVWIGRSLNCLNTSCLFHNNEPNVVSFYNDLEIREEVVEFPPGAVIISRCVDIGKFVLMGSNVRSCIHSEWNVSKPICYGLNQENDYAMEKSPTILFRHQNGPIAQSNDGKLIVYPGTTLHMECLWMRRFGNPKWNVSHEFRKYPEGWVTDENRDPQLEYRLSIFNAVEEDSGIFSCQTPARHEHAVDVVVKAINCPEIPAKRGLIMSTTDTKLSTKLVFSCANGNSLIGASEITCMPSSNWSAPLPVCESVECGDIPLLTSSNATQPLVAVLSREVGGRAAFSCPSGYGLRGSSESVCLPSGEWAQPFPTCIEVQCDNPGAPQNGYAQGSGPYKAGDIVQFNCNPEYMMQGQPIIACQDNGRWSGGLPKCVQACSYPGTAISGRMSSVKFYYAIGESITFTCDSGLILRGAKMLKCLRNGKWSNAIPTCVSADAAEDTDRVPSSSKSGRKSNNN